MNQYHKKAVLVLAALVGIVSAHSSAHAGANLLNNPSLEAFQPVLTGYRNQTTKVLVDTPADWSLVLNYPSKYTMDTADAMFGGHAIVTEIFCHPTQTGGGAYLYGQGGVVQQFLPIKPGTTYTLSYYVKVDDVKTTYAHPAVYDYSSDPITGKLKALTQKYAYFRFDNPNVNDNLENLTWKRISLTFKTDPAAEFLKVNAQVKADFSTTVASDFEGASHLAWTDGIQLEEGSVATEFNDNSNNAPVANAGENLAITSEALATTILAASASDADGTPLLYRWVEGDTVIADWQPVGNDGSTALALSTAALLSVGEHTLTLEVADGMATSTDSMILTIDNSAPHAGPMGSGVYEYGTPIVLGGNVSDFDGDQLTVTWREGETVLFAATINAIQSGTPVELAPVSLGWLSIGEHTFTLVVEDGVNVPVVSEIGALVIDSVAPTLTPTPNKTILWPPNHQLLDIVINANATDNSGSPVTLSATVTSDEPQEGLGDGDVGPDWTEPGIDQTTGVTNLKLRAERSGSGDGRDYTITLTATDISGNSSSASVVVIVPHDKRK